MTLNGAIMQLVEMRENSMMPEVFKPYFDKVIETVSECEEPSSEPERKKGEWIKIRSGNGWNDWINLQCPYCGKLFKEVDDKDYHFCPTCGHALETSEII